MKCQNSVKKKQSVSVLSRLRRGHIGNDARFVSGAQQKALALQMLHRVVKGIAIKELNKKTKTKNRILFFTKFQIITLFDDLAE